MNTIFSLIYSKHSRVLLLEPGQNNLKLVSAIIYQNFISHQMVALQKLWKMFFISSKKLFSFFKFLYFRLPLFFHLSAIAFDVINCLNKILITHFVWYLEKEKRYDHETFSIDRVLNKEHFYGNVLQKMYTKS